MKNLSKSCIVLFLLFSSSAAFSDLRSDTERLLNWAEDSYPGLFSQTADTQFADFSGAEWCFRAYPDNIFAGVVCNSGSGFIQGDLYTYINNELHNYGSINQFRAAFENHGAADSAGNGSCVNIPFTAHEGVIETLRISLESAQGSTNIEHINEYVSVTNTGSTTKVTTSNISGLGDVSESTLKEKYHIQGNFLYPDSSVITTTTNVIGTQSTITNTTTINPSYKASPVNTFCQGQTWTANAYAETISGTVTVFGFSSDTGSSTLQMPGYTGTVSSINQSVTVPAGTFNTVQLDLKMTNGDSMTSWITTDIGALVKMNITSSVEGQTFTGVTELISLQRK